MKKLLFILFSFLIFNSAFASDGRVCETKYTTIAGIKYFAGLHCTEDIKLTGVIGDKSALKNVGNRVINEFLIANSLKISEYLRTASGTCENIGELDSINSFENVIYENNDMSYSEFTTAIESLTEEIENLKENYNDESLYNDVFEEIQSKYSSSSIDSQRNFAREEYFNRQLEIKNEILEKQKEKLTKIYMLQESQKFIENFYIQVNRVCRNISGDTDIKPILDKEAIEAEKLEKIEKYKSEFNEKLGERLDKMSKQVLQSLSIKLITYSDESPLFKRFSEAQKELVKLKISALKQAIDDRIN